MVAALIRSGRVGGGALLATAVLAVGAVGCGREAPPSADTASGASPEIPAAPPIFEDVTDAARLMYRHEAGRPGRYFFPEIMAPGGALFDFDGDGRLDVYFVNGGAAFEGRSRGGDEAVAPQAAAGAPPVNRLFRQEPDGRFTDVTDGSGLGDGGFGMGVAVGDVNNDGLPDVYVTNYGADRLFLNQGDGTFLDVTEAAGIDNPLWGASVSFFDFDRDGWLDLYVTNYVDYDRSRRCADPRGDEDYCGPQNFPGTADRLYRNVTGDWLAAHGGAAEGPVVPRFEDVSLSSGIALRSGPGLGVVCADFDGDGWPDVYVANDGAANFLWINNRDGTFREEAVPRGAAYDIQGRAQAGMGIAIGDVNHGGRFDLLLTHLDGEMNALYLGTPGGAFSESAAAWGLAQASFPWTGFGTAFADLDHSGALDLIVVNGRVKRPPGARAAASDAEFWSVYAEPNQVFLNDGEGGFRPLAASEDPFLREVDVSRGLVVGDVDNDGALDLLVLNTAGPARLYRNRALEAGSWLMVRAVLPEAGGRDAYGAVVRVEAAGRTWTRLVQPGSSYLSSNDPRVHFGLGAAERVDRIAVTWPDGRSEVFEGGPVNRLVTVQQGEGRPE